MDVGKADRSKISNIGHILESVEGGETQPSELGREIISLDGDRFCEATEPCVYPGWLVRVGQSTVGSSREWSGGGFAFLSQYYHVSKLECISSYLVA